MTTTNDDNDNNDKSDDDDNYGNNDNKDNYYDNSYNNYNDNDSDNNDDDDKSDDDNYDYIGQKHTSTRMFLQRIHRVPQFKSREIIDRFMITNCGIIRSERSKGLQNFAKFIPHGSSRKIIVRVAQISRVNNNVEAGLFSAPDDTVDRSYRVRIRTDISDERKNNILCPG